MQYVCDIPDCKPNGTTVANRCLVGDHSSPAQFYVCVGVLAFLYCTATLVLYLGYQQVYKNNTRAPTVVRFLDRSFFSTVYMVALECKKQQLSEGKEAMLHFSEGWSSELLSEAFLTPPACNLNLAGRIYISGFVYGMFYLTGAERRNPTSEIPSSGCKNAFSRVV